MQSFINFFFISLAFSLSAISKSTILAFSSLIAALKKDSSFTAAVAIPITIESSLLDSSISGSQAHNKAIENKNTINFFPLFIALPSVNFHLR
ncbi:hypothetical protein bcere0005_51250 [Bacillus cereus 172560W]|nr:hypothetical protein bcere0005_51250 [Bacillus cereus 172560W]